MRMISWNVNGIRAAVRHGFHDAIAKMDPDIICLQETRARIEQVDLDLPGYETYWYDAEKKGYSGTAILSRIPAQNVEYGLGVAEHDNEGRVVTAEFEDYYLITVYTPNSKRKLERLGYRHKEWDPLFLKHCKELETKKPVIFCGDLNVAHTEIDIARPKDNRKNAGFTDEEREGFDNIVAAGFLDTFREFESEGGHYTWWSRFNNARERNVGWRIDYFCISPSLRPQLKSASIHDQVFGSDHCPVEIELA